MVGRARGKKVLVVIAVECRGEGSRRVRMAQVADASAVSLHASSRPTSSPARHCAPMPGRATGASTEPATDTNRCRSAPRPRTRPSCCRGPIGALPSSSAGCSALTRAASSRPTSTATSTSSPSGSPVALPSRAACSSTGSSTRPCAPRRSPIDHQRRARPAPAPPRLGGAGAQDVVATVPKGISPNYRIWRGVAGASAPSGRAPG